MAHKAGGGGGGVRTTIPAYPIFNADQWLKDKEEERRRLALKQQAQQKAKIGGSIGAGMKKPAGVGGAIAPSVRTNTFFPQGTVHQSPGATSDWYRERAKEIAGDPSVIPASFNYKPDTTTEYVGLVRAKGQEAVDKRVTDTGLRWEAHNGKWTSKEDAGSVIWELVKSNLTIDEIDQMIRASSNVLAGVNQGRYARQQMLDNFMVDMRNNYDFTPEMQRAYESVFLTQEQQIMPTDFWTGITLLSFLVPLPGIQGYTMTMRGAYAALRAKKIAHAIRLATLGGATVKVGGVAGAAIKGPLLAAEATRRLVAFSTGLGAVSEHLALKHAENVEREWEGILGWTSDALSPLTFPNYAIAGPPGSNVVDLGDPFEEAYADINILRNLENPKDAYLIESLLKDAGYGLDLEFTKKIDGPWIPILLEYKRDVLSAAIDLQRLAKDEYDAPHTAEINGDLTSDDWPEYLAHRHVRLAEETAYIEQNPERAAFLEMSGMPITPAGRTNYYNKLLAHGGVQALFKAPLMAAESFGGGLQALTSSANLDARKARNPAYRDAFKKLEAYVLERMPELEAEGDDYNPLPFFESAVIKAVKDGPLSDDLQAQALLANVNGVLSGMIDERYSPDVVITAGLWGGWDYEEAMQWGRDHPDLVRETDLLFWGSLIAINPIGRLRGVTTRRRIPMGEKTKTRYAENIETRGSVIVEEVVKPGNPRYFQRSLRARHDVKLITDWLLDYKVRRAAHRMGRGRDVPEALGRMWHVVGKGDKQRVRGDSQIIQSVARDVAEAVLEDNYALLNRTLRDAPSAFIENLFNRNKAYYESLKNTAVAWEAGARAQAKTKLQTKIASDIVRRQNRYGDAISRKVMQERVMDSLSNLYANGADIFPHYRYARLKKPGKILDPFIEEVSHIQNPLLRRSVGMAFGWALEAPTTAVELKSPRTLDRVFAAAYLASRRDFAWATEFANKWIAARGREPALKALGRQLAKRADENYIMPGSRGFPRRLDFLGRLDEEGGQALAPWEDITMRRKEGVVAEESVSESLTAYMGKDGRIRQAVPDTAYEQYMIKLPRAALWAPYRTPNGAHWFMKGLTMTQNMWRSGIWAAHYGSRLLRQTTVAAGSPLLFQKHAVTDSGRTLMEEGPFTMLQAIGWESRSLKGHKVIPSMRSNMKRAYDRNLAELDPHIRDLILHTEARTHASMAQFYAGKRVVDWKAKSIRDDAGRIINLDESAAALRRVTMGEAFRIYAERGAEGVWEWLNTKEGRAKLHQWGWTDSVKNTWEQSGVSTKGKQQEIMNVAQKLYMDRVVTKEWGYLEGALPNIMPILKEMSVGKQLLGEAKIKELIQKYPTDNAVLSQEAVNWKRMSSVSGEIIGVAMSANKWNRDIVFRRTFNKVYRQLKKEGAKVNEAAQIAATVAELRTAQIHFDLANALMIEARHRWAVWFATKHRLYNTHILKLATERPQVAAAALEIRDWLEERNARMGIDGYDKYKLVLNIGGGKQWRFNVAPWFWLTEYSAESALMYEAEKGLEYMVKEVVGADRLSAIPTTVRTALAPAPMEFGQSLTRLDPLFIALHRTVMSEDVKDTKQLTAWLETLPPEERIRWNKLILKKRAELIARGEDVSTWPEYQELIDSGMSPNEARNELEIMAGFNRVKAGNLKYELLMAFRPYSGRGYFDPLSPEELEIEKITRDYWNLAETDPDAAHALLQNNRLLQASIGLSNDPVEKVEFDEAFTLYNQLNEDFSLKIESLTPEQLALQYNDLITEYYDQRDRLTNKEYATYSEPFAKYFADAGNTDIVEALGFLSPLIPADSVWQNLVPMDQATKDGIKKTLKEGFDAEMDRLGNPPSTSLIYQIKKRKMVDEAYAKAVPEDVRNAFIPSGAQTMARFIARGGEAGPYRADAFLDLVESKTLREIVGRASRDGKGQTSYPWLGVISPEEAEAIGWNQNPENLPIWEQYAMIVWTVAEYRRTNHITATSKKGKELAKQVDDAAALLAKQYPDWGVEYYLSLAPVYERFRFLGVGTTGEAEGQGYADFFTITEDYFNALENADNPSRKEPGVGPKSQTAGPITDIYLHRVAELAKSNPSFWTSFNRSFTLTKFGYYWWSPDPDLAFLRAGETAAPTKAEESEFPWYSTYQSMLEEDEEWYSTGEF